MAAYALGPPVTGSIIRTVDGVSIPPDPANADYQEYLVWLAVPNVPDPYVAPLPVTNSNRNWLINPNGQVVQQTAQGSSTLADTNYYVDQWYVLHEALGNGTMAGGAATFVGVASTINFITTAVSQKMGVAQVIELNDTAHLKNKPLTASAIVRAGENRTVKIAILEWTGAANVVDRDVVNNWASTNYTAGNFFKSTTLNVIAHGEVALLADKEAIVSCSGVAGNFSANMIVFIWSTTPLLAKSVSVWSAELAIGGAMQNSISRGYSEELMLCRRFFERADMVVYSPATQSAGVGGNSYSFKNRKRTIPAVSFTVGTFQNITDEYVSFKNASDSVTTMIADARL